MLPMNRSLTSISFYRLNPALDNAGRINDQKEQESPAYLKHKEDLKAALDSGHITDQEMQESLELQKK